MEVVLRISRIPSTADATRKQLPFGQIVGGDIVLISQLGAEASLNDHLVWIWGMVRNERRFLASLAAQGAVLAVTATNVRRPIEIRPNGAELMHLLGAALVVEA
jgi:hypothetical protein